MFFYLAQKKKEKKNLACFPSCIATNISAEKEWSFASIKKQTSPENILEAAAVGRSNQVKLVLIHE